MSFSLKSAGQATELIMLLAVDDDGTTVKEFVSSAVNAAMTVDSVANFPRGASNWKGISRYYYETKANGTFGFFGVTFGATKPVLPVGTGQSGIGVFIAFGGSSGTTRWLMPIQALNDGLGIGTGGSAGKNAWYTAGTVRANSTTSLPTDGTTKFSTGINWKYNVNGDFFYGLESGSLAADGVTNPGGFGSVDSVVNSVGGGAGQGNYPAKIHLVAIFNLPRTLAQFQALHDDWFNELFNPLPVNISYGSAFSRGHRPAPFRPGLAK